MAVAVIVRATLCVAALAATIAAIPANARDSLGLYGGWGAFRDAQVPRCYAIAMAEPNAMQRDFQPYAAIGTWPRKNARNQVHFRLSRKLATNAKVRLRIGDRRFDLIAGEADAWPRTDTDNAAIIAAMRSFSSMTASSRDARARPFSNRWRLAGAASAIDAAAIGCAGFR